MGEKLKSIAIAGAYLDPEQDAWSIYIEKDLYDVIKNYMQLLVDKELNRNCAKGQGPDILREIGSVLRPPTGSTEGTGT